jgi:wyosine [tRNA(Phe)-imidazoG37] synthetase (radical SAM superfamily)
MIYKHLFGPVPSRRFGRSLGIDLVTAKTCSFDCPFCEVGRTTLSTCKRTEYVPTKEITCEFSQWLKLDGQADVITLAGSGEPTLHSRFGNIIDSIKDSCDIPVVLLTNSSLMHIPEVRQAAAKADIVKCSLSAWDNNSFQLINRPAAGIELRLIIDGLQQFRKIFGGKLWLEVFILKSVNDKPSDIAKIAALAETIAPDRVQLNTVVRPPAENSAQPISHAELLSLSPLFSPPAEIIARFSAESSEKSSSKVTAQHVLAMLTRRPCSEKDIAGAFAIEKSTAEKFVQKLIEQNAIRPVKRMDAVYYSATDNQAQ